MKDEGPSLVYPYNGGLYINLTGRCPTACAFCIKFKWEYRYRGHNLKLPRDPSVADITAAAGDVSRYQEAVFCGYGESTYRLKEMEELARLFRRKGVPRVRLNTIGLGNLINGRDITPDLGRFLDAVHVSLNTINPLQYEEMMRPLPEYRGKALPSVLEFAAGCVRHIPETVISAVQMPAVDAEAVRRKGAELGAQFRLRPYLDGYEEK